MIPEILLFPVLFIFTFYAAMKSRHFKKPLSLIIPLLIAAHCLHAAQPSISDVQVRQLPGTRLVEVIYTLEIDKGRKAHVTLQVSRDGGQTFEPVESEPLQLWGDHGVGVEAGTERRIVWDAGQHGWEAAVYPQTQIEITAVWEPVLDGGDPTAVAWEAVNERWVRNYYDNGDITMTDRDTGLMWVYDASAMGMANWSGARNRCTDLTYANHSDWILPNRDQLSAMFSQKEFFRDVQEAWYWSSTRHGPSYFNSAWRVHMGDGNVNSSNQSLDKIYWVWPCRGAQ